MTAEAALQQFLSGFGLPAFAASAVPHDAAFPYLTYTPAVGDRLSGEISVPCDLWYRTDSEAVPNAKARALYAAVGAGGVLLPCDSGALWLKRGTPWCRSLSDQADWRIKRRRILLTAEYLVGD